MINKTRKFKYNQYYYYVKLALKNIGFFDETFISYEPKSQASTEATVSSQSQPLDQTVNQSLNQESTTSTTQPSILDDVKND